MKLILTGVTGMVGSQVLREAIADNDITEITAITRRQPGMVHPKLKTVLHHDFSDYSTLTEIIKNNDAVIWCLGISQNMVSKEEYIKITYDYTLAFAKAAIKLNPGIVFLFLSGAGADNTEKTKLLFGKIKGRTENVLMKMPFKYLYIARPAAILPVQKLIGQPFILKLQYAMVKVFKYITPSLVITSAQLAKALVFIAKTKPGQQLIHQTQLKQISSALKADVN